MTPDRLLIRTGRIELRPLTSDIAEAAVGDRGRLAELIGAAVEPAWPADLAPLLPLYRTMPEVAENAALGWGPWIVIDPDLGELVADAGFKGAPNADGEIEIGYGTVERFRGRGYATEAAAALMTWAREHPTVTTITAECEHDNAASIRVLTKVGMQQIGARDSLLLWRTARY